MTATPQALARIKYLSRIIVLLGASALAFAISANAWSEEARFDPKPWLDDLAQTRETFATKYANLEWAVFDRQADLPALFADTEKRLDSAQSETDARAAFDRFARKLGDGHTGFRWPSHAVVQTETASEPCGDFDAAIVTKAMATGLKAYQPVAGPHDTLFPIGIVAAGKHRVGVIRIGLFEPQGYPELCKAALTRLSIPADKPCDDTCAQRIGDFTNKEFSEDFMAQLEALKTAKPDMLLLDITGNGGGSEWAEAVARMLTPKRIHSERMMFVRGEHWVKHFSEIERDLRDAAAKASPADRKTLLGFADQAAAKKQVAATPCDSAPLWQGKRPDCSWLGEGFSTTGILASADPNSLRGKPWAADVFTPMEFPYREGIWRGPLLVAVDSDTGSASEEFAATLQDNNAALIVGEATVGAGCGHTDGGTPTELKHSHAILALPDCARIRADGTNEVRGIRPDVLVGWRKMDGTGRRAEDFDRAFPDIMRRIEERRAH